jgi:hypothetical protein
MIKRMTPAHITSLPSVIQTLGRMAESWERNKYGKAAKEIAQLELSFPQQTGPPQRAQGMQRGFIDVLV